MNRNALGIAILLLAACAGPTELERVEVPAAAPVVHQVAPNQPSTTDEAATQRWLEEEANRRRGGAVQTGAPMEQPAQPAQEPAPQQPAAQPGQPHGGLVPRAQDESSNEYFRQPVTNEDATRAWLDRTIEQRRAANPDVPPVPMQEPAPETGYVDRPIYHQGYPVQGYGYDAYGQPVYQPCPQPYSSFPLNTVVGAGVGAVIGHQSHHQSEGAWIGAGVGLLLDIFNTHYH